MMNYLAYFITTAIVILHGTTSTDAAFLTSSKASPSSLSLLNEASFSVTTTPAFQKQHRKQDQSWSARIINRSSRSSSSISMATAIGETSIEGGSHFIDAGKALISAADAAGSQDYACPHLLRDIGESLKEIGEGWSTSWEAVTYSAYDASGFFVSLSQLQKRQVLAKAYAAAAGDLSAISAISGCVSVGPPSSVPALISLSTHLKEAADAVSDEEISSGSECKDSVALSRLLKVASVSIGDLAKEYD